MNNKFISRKFLAMVAGVLTGIALIFTENITEGTIAVISAIVSYLIAEGYIDAKAVGNVIDEAKDVLQGVGESAGEQND